MFAITPLRTKSTKPQCSEPVGFIWNLQDRPQNFIAVFTHGEFLYTSLAEALTSITSLTEIRLFDNCEHRVFEMRFEE